VLLARAIARHAARPLHVHALVRRLPAPPQAGLGALERRANLRCAFVVAEPRALAGHDVLLIDDVITTTATADACAGALLGAGVRRVVVYAVGRTPRPPCA
jgi:predicted amidophosphoribosyltransferase